MSDKSVSLTKKKSIPEPEEGIGKFSRCTECKNTFEQEWNSEKGMYSTFRTCSSCRKKSIDANSRKMQINLDYSPHRFQQLVHSSKCRFKVIAAGARGGKDYCCVVDFFIYLMKCANEERPATLVPKVMGWIIAPTETIARQNWRDLKRVIPPQLIADESKSTGQMTLINGVLIELHSAYDPESLVAVALDCVLITEAARVKDLDIVWDNLEMRLNSPHKGIGGKGGMALINSSPLGKNYFYKLFQLGQKGNPMYDPDWESFHWTTWDNPYMAAKANEVKSNGRTYKENLKRRMSDTRYRQDIMGEFLSNVYSVFPDIRKCLEFIPDYIKDGKEREEYIQKWRMPKAYNVYTIGYDPASIGDDPIVWVIENDSGKLVKSYNLKGMGWDAQFDKITEISVLYNHAIVKFGRTGHEIVDSQLTKRGLQTIAINEQGANKANLVENLARIVENQNLVILDDHTDETDYILTEFEDYIRDGKGKNVTYHNETSGGHDDHVSAAYFAFYDFGIDMGVLAYDGYVGGI